MSNPKMGKTGEEAYVVAKYDYTAQGSQELDIKKNERLILLDDSKHWWKVQNSKNQSGFVPSNYVKREKPSIFDSIRRRVRKKNDAKMSPTASPVNTKEVDININSSSNNISPKSKPYLNTTALVKYHYQAQQADEISLVKGSRVLVMEKSSDGWWKGEYNGNTGWFPSNYVLEESDDIGESGNFVTPDSSAPSSFKRGQQCLDVVVALYAFTAQNDEELTFQKDEHLEIIDRPLNDPDWWKARNQQGEIGLVPKNYVQVLVGNRTGASDSNPIPITDSMMRVGFAEDGLIPPASHHSKDITKLSQVGAMGGSPLAHPKHDSANQTSVNNASQAFNSAQPELNEKPWYFGRISRKECEKLLNDFGDDGDFIIRDSETTPGAFSLSLKAPMKNMHFKIRLENDLYCIGSRSFASLDDMVEHYKRAPINTTDQGEKFYLVKAFRKP